MTTTKSRTGKPRSASTRTTASKPRAAGLRTSTKTARPRKPAAVAEQPAVIAAAAPRAAKAATGSASATKPAAAPKPAAGKAASGKSADKASATAKAADDNTLKKKQLVERVVKLSGAKKRDAKDVVEATLTALGEALAAGQSVNLPPLGRMTINRQKDLASGEVLIVKLRRKPAGGKAAANPLAETDGEG